MPVTHYDELEVHPNASLEVIKAAYHALMKIHHPDISKNELRARRLNTAYEVLSDPSQRAQYDSTRNNVLGKVIQGIRIESTIAEGGFGKTYKGTHVLTGLPVCLKHCSRISQADAMILIEETKAMWDLRHYALPAARNLIQLEDGSMALVMSFIQGPTLAQAAQTLAKRNERFHAEDVAWITDRLLNALSYMHRHGVVHGDLKPQNIILQPESHSAFLIDFGLSAVKPTKTTGSKGYTDLFSPPEQIKGSPLIPQTDFYALGKTMLYALTGDEGRLSRLEVPTTVPDPICTFFKRLIVREPLQRPDWRTEDIIATFTDVRKASFGRAQSGMRTLKL